MSLALVNWANLGYIKRFVNTNLRQLSFFHYIILIVIHYLLIISLCKIDLINKYNISLGGRGLFTFSLIAEMSYTWVSPEIYFNMLFCIWSVMDSDNLTPDNKSKQNETYKLPWQKLCYYIRQRILFISEQKTGQISFQLLDRTCQPCP